MSIEFPQIDPVALSLGPIDIRWYALSYMAGFLLGWWAINRFLRVYPSQYLTKNLTDDLLTWIVVGVIFGGRFGYVIFYNFDYYTAYPLEALKIWQGGMAFHGGLIGVIIAMILFAWRYKVPFFALSDRVAVVIPIGLFFGRIANFVNGELYGRPTDVSWGMVFQTGDVARHPSQLYQAATEGLILFVILVALQRFAWIRERVGVLSGVFLAGYGVMRFFVEYTREPDAHLGLLSMGLSMGQWLCIPMILIGMACVAWGMRLKTTA